MRTRTKVLCYPVVLVLALAITALAPARAAGLNIETATIADLNAAFASGTLTSEQLVSAYLKRIEAYDKQGPAINAIITLNKKALDEAGSSMRNARAAKCADRCMGSPSC